MSFYNTAASARLDHAAKQHLAETVSVISDEGVTLPAGRTPTAEGFDQAVQGLIQALADHEPDSRAAGAVMIGALAHALGLQLSMMPRESWDAAMRELGREIIAFAREAVADRESPAVGRTRQ